MKTILKTLPFLPVDAKTERNHVTGKFKGTCVDHALPTLVFLMSCCKFLHSSLPPMILARECDKEFLRELETVSIAERMDAIAVLAKAEVVRLFEFTDSVVAEREEMAMVTAWVADSPTRMV